jgi:3-methyladenine DNA glycosylase Tag
MANEFGEDWSIYVWPLDHEDGTPFPDDMYERLNEALKAGGFGWETV